MSLFEVVTSIILAMAVIFAVQFAKVNVYVDNIELENPQIVEDISAKVKGSCIVIFQEEEVESECTND